MQRGRDVSTVACRELLRHLDRPARLRSNALLRQTSLADADDDELTTAVRALVDDALATLSARRRTIVVRCDLGGELCASVASALSISRRHLFREHARAV